ncbi:MAG: hypothetical protein IT436_13465 [Phycisphaerales bacterium]|nr:hypothetical protein [Phycisphaerales bacterium]
MARLGGRVLKIERERREARAAARESRRELLRLIAGCEVRHRPDLALVEPSDTDPATYRDVQATLALARGDFAQAERFEAQRPAREPALTGDARRDVVLMAEWMNLVLVPGVHASIEREDEAIARARARRGPSRAEADAGAGAARIPCERPRPARRRTWR